MTQNKKLVRSSTFPSALLAFSVLLLATLPAVAEHKETATFIPIGFLEGDDTSSVYAVDDAVTLAGCYSYHRDPNSFVRIFSYAARWTPGDGLQPLPRLPDTPNGDSSLLSFAGARDLTVEGHRIAFTAPTEDLTSRASAISDPDGSNLIELTSLPNGEKMQVVSQLSDDGTTAFGYRLVDLYREGAIWTLGGGVEAITPVAGYTNIAPTNRAISSDGAVSAGDLFSVDPTGFFITANQAYRWTSSGGVEPIPFLPDDSFSYAFALSADGSTLLGGGSLVIDSIIYFHRFFLWREGGTLTDLGLPQYDAFGTSSSGSGVSADGQVILVSAGGYGFIRHLDYDFYFQVEDIFEQAGLSSSIEGWSNFNVGGITDDGNTLYGQATNPQGKGEGFIVTFPPNFLRGLIAPSPIITSALSVTATLNDPFVYLITASGAPESFGTEDLPPDFTLETGTSQPGNLRVGIISGTPNVPGIYTIPISATNVAGTANAMLTLTVAYAEFVPRLLNISTRASILTDDKVLIAGFIIPTGGPKTVILRAIGPSLADVGLSGLLEDPVLELHSPDGTMVTNDNWQDLQKDEIEATGYAPSADRESALVATLDPGSYTVIISGQNQTTGIGLVEVYDLDTVVVSQMTNLSTRAFVDSGDNVLIGGITIGSTSQPQILVRAIGPSLEALGVDGALADPVLEIHGTDGSLLFSNDNWRDTQETELEASGLAPSNDLESAIIVTLPPDQYTAIVGGKDDTTGVGLVEVYNLSQ